MTSQTLFIEDDVVKGGDPSPSSLAIETHQAKMAKQVALVLPWRSYLHLLPKLAHWPSCSLWKRVWRR